MKVLFLIQDERLPSSRIRVINLLPELKQFGISCEVRPYPHSSRARFQLFAAARDYEVVYLQKKMPSLLEYLYLRRAASTLVFDFDDAIYFRHDAAANPDSFTRRSRFNRVVRGADLVVAGNRVLAARAMPVAKRVTIIPSAIETRGVPVKDHQPGPGPVIIGWIGTSGNFNHLELAAPAIQNLALQHRCRLTVVSDRSPRQDFPALRFMPWSLDKQEQHIAGFDIGIMPLPDTLFARGKCGYKALQYMAAGVPPVVSDVGGNREIVEHGVSGLVVSQPAEFHAALARLIQEPGLRSEYGWNARQRAEAHYSIQVVAGMLAKEIKALRPSSALTGA